MKRVAFTMKLKPDCEAEYKKRHDAIWPELVKALQDAGVYDYSIFLDPDTNVLFAVQKVKECNSADELPTNPTVQKWWAMMADIMDTNPDNSPVCKDIEEVFHME
ncbi:MAG: L-rhamnose mutarotase [Clostridiales bacterium]|nr:L-rhamnose mutarotase [Clostridiales bacterium]